MKSRLILLFVPLLFLSIVSQAQKEITLINGQRFHYTELKLDSNWISFNFINKHKKEKEKILSYEDVFVINDGAKEIRIYGLHQDTTDLPGFDEMRQFVNGQQSGRIAFRPTRHFIMGAAVGFASGVALNSFLAGSAVPPVYTILTTVFPVGNGHFRNDPNEDPAYRLGQKKQYKRMRTGMAIKSSILGVAVGLIAGHYVAQ